MPSRLEQVSISKNIYNFFLKKIINIHLDGLYVNNYYSNFKDFFLKFLFDLYAFNLNYGKNK